MISEAGPVAYVVTRRERVSLPVIIEQADYSRWVVLPQAL
jgi:hypothetical protein